MPISKDRLKSTFLELIAINSLYPDDLVLQKYVIDRCNRNGISCVTDGFGNIIASLPGDESRPAVMLSTHIDIPEDTPQVSYHETADGIEGTGKTILGADPKTGLAVLLELAEAMASGDPDSHAPVDFVYTRGEERGLLGARALDISKVRAREGLVIDEDGPANVVVTQAPGQVRFEGTFRGKTAHSREPWLGVNALQIAVDAISQVPLGYTDSSKRVTWNIGMLNVGAAVNSVPCKAHFMAEMRSFDGELLQSEARRIRDLFAETASKAGGLLEAELDTSYDTYSLETEDPFVVKIAHTLQKLSLTPSYLKTYGASDANIFNARGIRCAAIGSGYYNAHQYVERADFNDMQTLAIFLDSFVRLPN